MKGGISLCVFDKEFGRFRVIQSKGKTIFSFGVTWSTTTTCTNTSTNKDTINETSHNENVKSSNDKCTAEYLFIEETLFLHERGYIQAFLPKEPNMMRTLTTTTSTFTPKPAPNRHNQEDNTNGMQNDSTDGKNNVQNIPKGILEQIHLPPLDTKELYEIMIQQLHIPLQVYLTYGYLRSQSYIVVRHTATRSMLIERLNRRGDKKNQDNGNNQKMKLDLRYDAFHAPVPYVYVFGTSTMTMMEDPNNQIAFDVYKPNSSYKKSNPGQPDFYVSIANYADESPPFDTILALIRSCNGIPLRMAAVADGGTVIMFGMTDFGVPKILK